MARECGPARAQSVGVGAMLAGMVLAVGCAAPAPLVRLAPTTPDVFWVSGLASVQREVDGIQVAAAFERQDDPLLGLRVEVRNVSDGPLDVDPREFTFTTCRGEARTTCATTQRVADPEVALAALDERQSREEADAANSQAALGVLVILSAAADVATLGGHRSHALGSTVGAANLARSDAAARQAELASVGARRRVWASEALRRNTVLPGSGVGGRVYLPIDPSARLVWLHVRVGGRVASFSFWQTVRQLDHAGPRPTREPPDRLQRRGRSRPVATRPCGGPSSKESSCALR